MRRRLEPRADDVSRRDASLRAREEVLAEGRVAVARRLNRRRHRRPARCVRELPARRHALALQHGGALESRAPYETRASIVRPRPVDEARHRRACTAGAASGSLAERHALSGARYVLHERSAPSARPATTNARTVTSAKAIATRRTGAAADAEVTVRTVPQTRRGSFPWPSDMSSLDSVILPLVRDHSANLSRPPGGACAKWLRTAVRARESGAP